MKVPDLLGGLDAKAMCWLASLALIACSNAEQGSEAITSADALARPSTDSAQVAAGDAGASADQQPPQPAKSLWGEGPTLKVAAVQYGAGAHASVGCADDLCAVDKLVRQAATANAKIIVTPEYGVSQERAELTPVKGDKPASDARWSEALIMPAMAKLADELDVVLVFNLITQAGSGSTAKLYNTQVAVDQQGAVIARHYKFHLFGNEVKNLTAGDSVTENFFDTPAGKMGLLICADIQCIVNGVGPDCAPRELVLLRDFAKQKATGVFFSALWTVGQPSNANPVWWPLNVQKKYAVETNSWVIASNTTRGPGRGGGVFKPGGQQVDTTTGAAPSVTYGEVPRQ